MELFGIRIRVHPTFVWLLLFFFLLGGVRAVAWVVLVFTFVVFHELCHSLVARAHGIPVGGITLLPIGGVAQLGAMPEDPITEFQIAFAGPMFNFFVAGCVFALTSLAGLPLGFAGDPVAGAEGVGQLNLLGMILVVNLGLGIFNLLPAFPMDGGRLLRAWLAGRRGYLEATRIAARVGRWVAAGMVAWSLYTLIDPALPWNFWLLLIAGFVYVSGKQEEMVVAARHAARGFWRLFGYAEPPPSPFREGLFAEPPEEEPMPRFHGDVIDVQGEVRRPPDVSAADAFRRLSEEIEAHLRR